MSLGQAEQFGGRMAGRNLTEGMVLPKESDIHPFEFNGNTKDYFGIWIVNVLLTIVTFGIYSSWAKVRNKKYFYGQTHVNQHNFDYHATGLQLFIGKLIVVGAFGVLIILQLVAPVLYLLAVLAFLFVFPALIVRALRFNARVSSYRNVRFNFFGEYGDAFIAFILIPLGNYFTLFLCSPFVSRAINRFVVGNHTYGDRKFKFDADIGNYYKPFLIALFVVIVLAFALMGPAAKVLFANIDKVGTADDQEAVFKIVIGFYAFTFLVLFPSILFYQAAIRNVMFNNTVLDGVHRFESTVNPIKYVWIVITNAVAALLTIGLLMPWGRVRLAKYMAASTRLLAGGPLDGYTSDVSETTGVISSEYVDMEGIDLGIGL